MGETCLNTVIPTSLVMRRCECFYCGVEDEGAVLIDWLFGIKVCEVHREKGERDCRAYLYRQNLVRIKDAMAFPIIKRFLDILAGHPLLRVERTNGSIEDDWCLRLGTYMEAAFFSYSSADRWGIPMYCKRINMNKTVPVINFLRSDLTTGMVLPADWNAIIEGVLDCLVNGIYKADAEAYDYARNHDDSEKIMETSGVATVIYEGRLERVFVGHLDHRPREDGVDKSEEVGEL
jgi:hypothetical protein